MQKQQHFKLFAIFEYSGESIPPPSENNLSIAAAAGNSVSRAAFTFLCGDDNSEVMSANYLSTSSTPTTSNLSVIGKCS